MDGKQRLIEILDRLEAGHDPAGARDEAVALIEELGTPALLDIEQRLVAAGMPVERMRHLCAAHAQASQGERSAFRNSLPPDHPVAVLMDEHVQILGRLAALSAAADRLAGERPRALAEMAELGAALVAAEPHHSREELVIFPALRERGMSGPPDVMEFEHTEIRRLKHAIHNGALALLEGGEGDEARLRSDALRLVTVLSDHIAKEDGILYPMAVQVIDEPGAWDELRARCDRVGYCCHQPTDGGCSHHG